MGSRDTQYGAVQPNPNHAITAEAPGSGQTTGMGSDKADVVPFPCPPAVKRLARRAAQKPPSRPSTA
ncbi:hypothetical protein Skr01_56370 [Sphaerisporangium krabiense]|nr:hypothetical protein Skr01_56370 [Sphaerisporangium krabiense]